MDRVVDTLPLARQKYPGAQASLDALCRRFGVDNSHRDLHGALIDADLLAAVYVELQGAASLACNLMRTLANTHQKPPHLKIQIYQDLLTNKPVRPPRSFTLPEQEAADHQGVD